LPDIGEDEESEEEVETIEEDRVDRAVYTGDIDMEVGQEDTGNQDMGELPRAEDVDVSHQLPGIDFFEDDQGQADRDNVDGNEYEDWEADDYGYSRRGEENGNWSDSISSNHSDRDEDNQPALPAVNILDQPFMSGFHLLSDMMAEGRTDAWDNLTPQPPDVDRWELVMSPNTYLSRFRTTLSTVQLVNRKPQRQLKQTFHQGPKFSSWLLLAKSVHTIWVHPKFKNDIISWLDRYQSVQAGKDPLQASAGQSLIPTSVFVYCLNKAGCDSLRIKAYGQKLPLTDRFLQAEPAEANHRLAVHNEWDIGTNFDSPYIWLFDSASGRRSGIQRYPMLVPGSRDYGTVNVKMIHRNQHYSLKIYPRMVHVIKSFNSQLQKTIPQSLHGVKTQLQSAVNMVNNLSGKDANALGGFRIEVTVKAVSLAEAVRKVNNTPYLNPSYWLGYGDGPRSLKPLSARLVSRKNLLDNANWIQQKAVADGIFNGTDANRPTRIQLKALVDIFNALGWNGGLRRPTKSLDPGAWWNEAEGRGNQITSLVDRLNQLCQTDDHFKLLFNTARKQGRPVPCKAEPDLATHRYHTHQLSPFVVRCCFRGCNSKLQRVALLQWLVTAVERGVFDGEDLMDDMEDALEAVEQEVDREVSVEEDP
jgi:hypothetical protein